MKKLSPYAEFLRGKEISLADAGLDIPAGKLNSMLFDFQRDIVHWALRKGRAALFCDCGMGKTPMQLEWASHDWRTRYAHRVEDNL